MEANMKWEHFDKAFVNCKIEWNIENFFFAIRPDINYIDSSDFTLQETKWKLILEFKWEEIKTGFVSLCLERLPDSEPDVVWVDGEMTLVAGKKQYDLIQFSYYFDPKSKERISLQSIEDILENFPPFEEDTLKIECNLLVCKQDGTSKPDKPINCRLRSLSDDFRNMLKQKLYTDVTIRVDDGIAIEAHRVILARNQVLKCLIQRAKNHVIELKNLDSEAVSRFIFFVYSGDIGFILQNPSISIYKCVEFFDCIQLMSYFAPVEFHMRTTFEIEEHELHWSIDNFEEKLEAKDCISSPLFKGINMSTTWEIKLDTNIEGNNGYLSVCSEIVEGEKPLYFCLEFGVEEINETIVYKKRILRYNQCNDDMGLKEFFKIDSSKISNLLVDEMLNIVFKVKTSKGDQKSSVAIRMSTITPCGMQKSFEILSVGMHCALDVGEFSDIVLESENEFRKAHKCILAARSPTFFRMIHEMPTDTNSISLSNINPHMLRIFLTYIYSCKFLDCSFKNLLNLYEILGSFDIPGLKEECIEGFEGKYGKGNIDAYLGCQS